MLQPLEQVVEEVLEQVVEQLVMQPSLILVPTAITVVTTELVQFLIRCQLKLD